MAEQKANDNLKISKVKKFNNILQIPIYCMSTFKQFVIIGGGGGNEIANKLMVFDASNAKDIQTN